MKEREIFDAALAIADPEERDAFLNEACEGDAGMVEHLRGLLEAERGLGSFLESPAAAPTLTIASPPGAERAGTVIGPYKLLEQLGAGGMGVVYMAEQVRPVRRTVALKIIKPGMDTRQVVARFEAERQALAMMDHPNIARVLDAGATDSGLPYFVMELVRGVPITEYCDRERLPVAARLELFVLVCRAIQHAHQKGIIHRDIKPTNVLITLHDGVPVPKVIDFGIAKATGGPLTEKTLHTGFAQLVGTPLYMSPEQAELSGLDIDTRSDIYSLGVLLYELLTGSTPFDGETLRKAAFDEMRRIIREDDPPRPSTRLGTLGLTISTVSARRGSDPRHLNRAVRGELDWITMKALEKDRRRRYETANDFAADVMRHLTDRPVEACPPSVWYRFGKFARRNRVALTTAGLIALALIVGTAVSIWQAVRAVKAERNTAAALSLAEVRRADADAQRRLAEERSRQARRAVDEMYTQVAEKWLAGQPRLEKVQREFLEKALIFYQEFARERGAEPAVRLEVAKAYGRVGEIRRALGQEPESEEATRHAVDTLEALVKEAPGQPEYHRYLVFGLTRLGSQLNNMGQVVESERALQRAVAVGESLVADFPADFRAQFDLAGAHLILGILLYELGRLDEADRTLRRSLNLQESLAAHSADLRAFKGQLARSYMMMGGVLSSLHRPEEAVKAQRRALEIVPGYTGVLGNLGMLLMNLHQFEEAEQVLRQAQVAYEKNISDHPNVPENRAGLAGSRLTLGTLFQQTRRVREAEEAFKQSLAVFERLVAEIPAKPDYRFSCGSVLLALGTLQANDGRAQDAEGSFRRAIAVFEEIAAQAPGYQRHRSDQAVAHKKLGDLLVKSGRALEAKEAFYKAQEILESSPNEPFLQNTLAWILATCPVHQVRDPARAVELARKAVENQPQAGAIWNTLGIALYRAGDWKAAVEALGKSTQLRKGGDSFDWFFLAMAHWQRGDRVRARTWYDRAVEWMDMNQPRNEELKRFRAEGAALMGVPELPADDFARP